MLRQLFTCIIPFLLCKLSLAQTDTSLFKSPDSTTFYSFYSAFDTCCSLSAEVFFQSSIPFWLYDVVPLYRDAAFNGNIASFRFNFSDPLPLTDSVFNIVPFFSHLFLKKNSFKSSVSQHPASSAIYTWGLKKEQTFHIYHTQRLAKQFAVNIYYNLLSAPGLYQRQRTNQQHFWSQFVWLQKDRKALISGGVTHNNILQNENGGIKHIENFTDTSVISREFIPVHIFQAERKIKQQQWYLDQHYRIFSDSAFFPLILSLQSGFSPTTHVFTDAAPDVTFYTIVFDTTATYDSCRHQSFWQKVIISNIFPFEQQISKKRVQFIFGASYNYDQINQDTTSGRFRWFEIFSRCSFRLPYRMNALFDVKYRSGEYVDGNYHLGMRIQKDFDKILQSISLSYSYDQLAPLYVFTYLKTNHSYWNNQFPLQYHHHFAVHTFLGNVSLRAGATLMRNFVYVNSYGIPDIFRDMIALYNIQVHINEEIGLLYASLKFMYQRSTQSDVFSVPEFYVQPQVGINWRMFNAVLHCFAGSEFFWFSSFYAPRWMVAQGLFAQQYIMKIGNYIYPSVFFGARLKRVRFFAHLDNITAGLLPVSYFAMPDYPRFDRFFRWGINWTFYN